MLIPPDQIIDIVVVGGGAAGFFAAVSAAEKASPRLLQILIIEKARHPLGKVLVSGGGRCNVTNACFDPAQLVTYYPRGAEALRAAFTRFQPRDTMAWFEHHGVLLKIEPDGRVFPKSDSAKSIVECLLTTAHNVGVQLWTQASVTVIQKPGSSPSEEHLFTIQVNYNDPTASTTDIRPAIIFARCVLLATGGDRQSLSLAAGLGHAVEPPVPSLFTFKLDDPRLAGLAGLSVANVNLRLVENENSPVKSNRLLVPDQQGALLITHWGLSGPAVLRLSAWGARWLHTCHYQAGLIINWLHPAPFERVLSDLIAYKSNSKYSRSDVTARCPFPQLPLRLWKRLVSAATIPEYKNWANLSKTDLHSLAGELAGGRFQIQAKSTFKEEFVTCGGVHLDEVNFRTMQSKIIPGLFLAGEVLDVDGLTGGFNFQNAWTTGWLAGQTLALAG